MKVTPLCLLIVLQPSCCLAFVSKSHAGISSGRLPPRSSPMTEATSTSMMARKRLTQMSLAISPLESTSSLLSVADVTSSLQIFYTATLVAGVGYSQRMAGRNDFKRDMATKIANGLITPEELVDEITLMAEEINNEINESKSFAEAAQVEVQNLLEEMKAMQERVQQIPDALNIEKAALAIEKEEPAVKATVQEKVLVTAGGSSKEKVTAGGRNEENAIPIGVVEGFGVYDDVFEMEEVEEEEMEWSVPVVHHDDEISKSAKVVESNESTKKKDTPDVVKSDAVELVTDALKTNEAKVETSVKAEESKESAQRKDIVYAVKKEAVELVADGLKTNGADRVEASKKVEESKESKQKKDTVVAKKISVKKDATELAADAIGSTEAIRKQAEDFRARIKQMEARINSDTTKQAEAKVAKVASDPKPSPSAPVIEDRILSDIANHRAKESALPDIKPSPPASEPPADTAKRAKETALPDIKPSPPASEPLANTAKRAKETALPDIKPSPPALEPPVKVLKSAAKTIKPKKVIPDGPIRSSPLARLLCSELGVELADVYPGTGLNGRVIADDVRNYAENRGNRAGERFDQY